MTTAETVLVRQRGALQRLHNDRFEYGGLEYRLTYRRDLTEYVAIFAKKKNAKRFRFVDGFYAYPFTTYKEASAFAKSLAMKNLNI